MIEGMHSAAYKRLVPDGLRTCRQVAVRTQRRTAAVHKVACVAQSCGRVREKIGVERHHDIGGGKIVDRIDRFAENHSSAFPVSIARGRLKLIPSRLREFLQHRSLPSTGNLVSQRRGADRFGENS